MNKPLYGCGVRARESDFGNYGKDPLALILLTVIIRVAMTERSWTPTLSQFAERGPRGNTGVGSLPQPDIVPGKTLGGG